MCSTTKVPVVEEAETIKTAVWGTNNILNLAYVFCVIKYGIIK